MGLQEFFIDVKNILFGKIDEENTVDLKQEIQNALKEGKIQKSDAALLIQTINEVKTEANELEKKQLSSISLEDGSVVSFEEYERKKSDLERKKREKEVQRKVAIESAKSQDVKIANKENKNRASKLNIDRTKMAKAIERDEIAERKAEQKLNKAERDSKN